MSAGTLGGPDLAGAPDAAEADEIRDEIHVAAMDVFREHGVADASEDEIIERAGTTRDEFDARFASKDAVLHEQAAFFAHAFADLIPAHKPPDRSVHATMQSAVRDIAAVVTADKDYQRVIWTCGFFFEPEGPVKDEFEKVYERWEQLFFDGQTAGEIHASRDPQQLTEMAMGIVYLTIVNWLVDWWDDAGHLQLRLARAVDQFLHGAAAH